MEWKPDVVDRCAVFVALFIFLVGIQALTGEFFPGIWEKTMEYRDMVYWALMGAVVIMALVLWRDK